MSLLSPPFAPNFGNGAPGANVPKNQPYFDTSTTPYTPYVWNGSAWKSYGVNGGTANAVQIQGISVSTSTPADLDTLIYSAGSNEWVPGAQTGGITPSVVQVGSAVANAVTLGAAPTPGNLLVALYSCFNVDTTTTGTGWTSLFNNQTGRFNTWVGFKWAGASESATQTPQTNSETGVLTIYEVNCNGIIQFGGFNDVTGSNTVAQNFNTPKPGLLLAQLCNQTGTTEFPTSVSGGVTLDPTFSGNPSGGSVAVRPFHLSVLSGNPTAITAVYAATATVSTPYALIG